MTNPDQLIDQTLAAEERDLLRRIGEDPSHVQQALTLLFLAGFHRFAHTRFPLSAAARHFPRSFPLLVYLPRGGDCKSCLSVQQNDQKSSFSFCDYWSLIGLTNGHNKTILFNVDCWSV